MEEVFKRALGNIARKRKWLYIVIKAFLIIFLLGVLVASVVLMVLAQKKKFAESSFWTNDLFTNMFASFVGVAALYFGAQTLLFFLRIKEDENKVSYRNRDMWQQYRRNYRQRFTMHNSRFMVYCEKQFLYKENETKLVVVDDPEAFFVLDPYIKAHCSTLLEAHAMSKKTDSVTVRLRDFVKPSAENGNKTIIKTGRSSYLAHLLTNRALDYILEDGLSIRKLYENDKTLRPPLRSQLSNHFGINALVFLKSGNTKDKWLLLPHRTKDATVAKNSLTASIATRLEMHNYADELQPKYITEECIRENIEKHIWVPKNWLRDNKISAEVDFLGLSRDIYEGGKPTLFYAVYLDMEPDRYKEGRDAFDKQKATETKRFKMLQSKNRIVDKDNAIDEVDKLFIADWKTVQMEKLYDFATGKLIRPSAAVHDKRLDQAHLVFVDIEKKKHFYGFEQNLIANFWFLQGCPEFPPSTTTAC